MKKTTLILIAMSLLQSHQIFAQLTVDSVGHVVIFARSYDSQPAVLVGSPVSTHAAELHVSRSLADFVSRTNLSTPHKCAIYGECADPENSYNLRIGVLGNSFSQNSVSTGLYAGVMGIAGNGAVGYNFGVYGKLVDTANAKGASIFGTNYSAPVSIDDKYAGYFHGKVKVIGNMNISGTINGVMIVPATYGAPESNGSNVEYEDVDMNVESFADRLSQLRPTTYHIPAPELKSINSDGEEEVADLPYATKLVSERKHYGLSLEGLQESFPELVYEQEDGTTGVNYMELIPALVQTINELNARVQELEGVKGKAKARSQKSTAELGNAVAVTSSVKSIAYTLPKDARDASLVISDTNGRLIKTFALPATGKHETEVNVDGLQDGIYLYSLVSEGNVLATKKMVVKK